MRLEDIQRITVIGGGTMGSQIVQLFSQVGKYTVIVYDLSDDILEKSINSIRETLRKYYVDKGLIFSGEMNEIIERVNGTTL